ncbi:MAG TPA: SPOR domain-containing protein [Salinimicrobium sp.]|nr:SPOR domain-containing protein [Salinimicrobium sp.]
MLKRNKISILSILFLFAGFSAFAQQGQVRIEQDPIIPTLMELKTEMAKNNQLGDRYKIQIFSGNNGEASNMIRKFRSMYSSYPSTIEYETPNYKVWVGNFRNNLEADRALAEIKLNFPAAFRFKPDRN